MYVHLNSYSVRNLQTFRGTLRFMSDKLKAFEICKSVNYVHEQIIKLCKCKYAISSYNKSQARCIVSQIYLIKYSTCFGQITVRNM